MTAAERAIRGQGRKQTWLAQKLGISRSDMSRKLRGERAFTPDQAEMLANLTGIPADLFLTPKIQTISEAPAVEEVA